jgi:hypothetical protein
MASKLAALEAKLAAMEALLAQSPAATPAPSTPVADSAPSAPPWLQGATVAPVRKAPAKVAKPKAEPEAKVVEQVTFLRLSFNGKPSDTQRTALKGAGGFAIRQGDDWFWFVPAQ